MNDENSPNSKPKRIKLPPKSKTIAPSQVTVIPNVENLINDALSIIGSELAQYKSKSKRGVTLDLKEARIIQGYVDSLTKAQKEAREQARAHDLSDLSDEELVQLAAELNRGRKALPSIDED